MFGLKKEAEPQDRADGLTDYDVYVMGTREKAVNILFAAAVLFGIGYIFYQNPYVSAVLMVLAVNPHESDHRKKKKSADTAI